MSSALPPRLAKQKITSWLLIAVCMTFFGYSLWSINFSVRIFTAGLPHLWSFLAESIPPDAGRLDRISLALLETFQMAFVGTIIGVALSIPLAIVAAPSQMPSRLIVFLARQLIAIFRTIPDLVWALIFVISVGLGPFAGTLAIIVDTLGFCGRFFAEAIEEVDKQPQEALQAIGANRLSRIACTVLPGALPSMVNSSLFALEKATRSSVVLGLVGAGGIGLELKVAMDMFRYNQALTIIILMLILVMIVEKMSMQLRKKLL